MGKKTPEQIEAAEAAKLKAVRDAIEKAKRADIDEGRQAVAAVKAATKSSDRLAAMQKAIEVINDRLDRLEARMTRR